MSKIVMLLFSLCMCSCLPTQYKDLEESSLEYQDNSRRPSSTYSEVSAIELRMGDRFYVASVFKDIFGPQYNNGNIVFSNVISNQGVFGGGCDLYERALKGINTNAIEDPWRSCFDVNWNTPAVLKSTTLREGWRIRTCELIFSSNPTALSYAFSKASVDTAQMPIPAELNKLYKLFYPHDELSQRTSAEMISWAPKMTDSQEFWESSLLAFCISPGWQVP